MSATYLTRKSTLEGVSGFFGLVPGDVIKEGEVTLSCFKFEEKEDFLFNLRHIRDGSYFMIMLPGIYTRLHVGGELMMSDTNMERLTNEEFVNAAHGRVLIAGLGIGLVLVNLRKKLIAGVISEIVVVEKSPDLIRAIGGRFPHDRIKIVEGDIFDWRPAEGEKFNTIYFDIWPGMSEDNLPQMNTLHRLFRKYQDTSDPMRYMDSWMREWLRRERRRNQRSAYY